MEDNIQVISYRHVRNKDCVYRRVDNTSKFVWGEYTRDESGIQAAIHYDKKFEIFEVKDLTTGEIKQVI